VNFILSKNIFKGYPMFVVAPLVVSLVIISTALVGFRVYQLRSATDTSGTVTGTGTLSCLPFCLSACLAAVLVIFWGQLNFN